MTEFAPLPDKRYEIIYIDCPWNYAGQRQHTKGGKDSGGADAHYSTVTTKDLKSFDIPSITAKNCLLFMWVTSPHLEQGLALMKAWGFKYATIAFVWYKKKTNPGSYTLSECEICLVGKHGTIPKPRGSRRERQFLAETRTVHSRKPTEIRKRIQRMFPTQQKIEVFARERVPGWDAYGNDLDAATTPDWP